MVEKALPKNKYLVRKVGTNENQVPHRRGCDCSRLDKHVQTPDVQLTSQKGNLTLKSS